MNLASILDRSQAYGFWKWIARRHPPEEGRIVLVQRRVYILPTRNGLTFAAALALMLVGSINYSLSLGFVLTFLLAGMAIVSILHTFRNLVHLAIAPGRVEPLFAGDTARFTLHLENERTQPRFAIELSCDGDPVRTGVPAERSVTVALPVASARRGWLALPRVTIETRFPLGLFSAWSYAQPAMRALVYPRPDGAPLPAPRAQQDAGDALPAGAGSDDFSGLRAYQAGDSPRHVAWKAVARGEELLTKSFTGRASERLMFDWAQLPAAMDVEARLSRLARWVLLAGEAGLEFGLRIPGTSVAMGAGPAQLAECLEALALYGQEAS